MKGIYYQIANISKLGEVFRLSIEDENQEKQKKSWIQSKVFIISSSIIALILIIGVGVGVFNHHQKVVAHQEAVSKALKLKQEKEKYIKSINEVSFSIGESAVKAESMLNDYSSVWHDVIFNGSVNINGNEATTIDDAIMYQSGIFDSNGDNDALSSDETKIYSEVKELNNPPKGYKEYHDLLINLYETYNQFADLALSPTGTYNSFTTKFNDMDSKIAKEQDDINIRLPKVKTSKANN